MPQNSKEGTKRVPFESPLGKRAAALAYGLLLAAGGTAACVLACSDVGEEPMIGQVEQAATAPVTLSFRNGSLPSTAYAGTDDGTIQQALPTTNSGTATSCEVDGDDGSGVDKSCLLGWDVSQIPAGSTVQSASITLRVTNATANSYGLYQVLKDWSETGATWQNATASLAWATAGALGASDRGPELGTVTGSTGSRTVTLNAAGVAMIQGWVNGSPNGGIIVANASNTDGIDFASSEHSTVSYRPRLDVTYLPPETTTSGSGGTTSTATTTSTSTSSTTGGGGISTDPNLKVGFIGDTGTGTNFRNVLTLIKNEGAAAVVVEGDMSYSANPTTWWNDVDAVLGTSFPVFIARGNHDDSSWSGYLARAATHLGGATREAGAHNASYKTTFRGLVIATIAKGDPSSRIDQFFTGDQHLWKICQWHQNQQAMQVGGKTDEMGWNVYETCRQHGAIIETGHEHSYSRTKTLTSMTSRVVDPSCSSATSLCVGPGRTFANVVGLGGNSVREQLRCLPAAPPYGCNGEWASIYTTNQSATYGAQFIVFNAGAANRATGYFKNINGQTIDSFSITHD